MDVHVGDYTSEMTDLRLEIGDRWNEDHERIRFEVQDALGFAALALVRRGVSSDVAVGALIEILEAGGDPVLATRGWRGIS